MLPSLYSPEIRPLRVPLVEEIDGAEERGCRVRGMRQEAVRIVDGLLDGQRTAGWTEVAVRRAVGFENGRGDGGGRLPSARLRGRPPLSGVRLGWQTAAREKQPSAGWSAMPTAGRTASKRPADGEVDGRADFHRSERPSATPRVQNSSIRWTVGLLPRGKVDEVLMSQDVTTRVVYCDVMTASRHDGS